MGGGAQLRRIALLLACALPAGVAGDRPVSIKPRPRPAERRAAANIRLDVTQVLIPVTVTDALDRPYLGLERQNFRIFEDGVEQHIRSFSFEEAPVSVGLLFDASGSMRSRVDKSREAVEQFVKASLPGDEFFLIRFNDAPVLETAFTPDPAEILRALNFVDPHGWTALHDAICLAAHEMKAARNARRALLILTDGSDNHSRYSESEVRQLVLESDLRVYAVGLFERPRFLEKLAAETGGSVVWTRKLKELPEAVWRLNTELRSQYVLGYSPTNPQRDGRYRKVRVELVAAEPELRASAWRRGYYAPE